MEVSLFFQNNITLKQRGKLKTFIKFLMIEEGYQAKDISIIFCSDEFLLDLNKQHLNHDYFTDIITFDLTPKKEKEITGELYISTDRVKFNAKDYNTTVNNELHRVIFHGILHLCGYKDKSKKDIAIMRAKELQYLNLYFPR
jgi:rRNA maturation RNase YbeY